MTSALLSLILLGSITSDEVAAARDLQRFPLEERGFLYYVTTACVEPGLKRIALDVAFKLVLISTSRQRVQSKNAPVPITDTCYRIDLRDMMWGYEDWRELIATSPYAPSQNWLLHRADWLVVMLTDATESDAYLKLTYGKVPKNRDELLAIAGVIRDPNLEYGTIEGKSRVSLNKVRRLINLPCTRGYAWLTQDVLDRRVQKDPLEQPEGDAVHDAEEGIIGYEKWTADGTRGVVQLYGLWDGKGNNVASADPRIVEDHTRYRDRAIITLPGSCIQCHNVGQNYPTRDDFKALLDAKVQAFADYATQQQLQQFYFADLEKDLQRGNSDFTDLILAQTGCNSTKAASLFAIAVRQYDEDLDTKRAAWESDASEDELKLALGWANSTGVRLPARAALLASGGSISRDAWEDGGAVAVKDIISQWRVVK